MTNIPIGENDWPEYGASSPLSSLFSYTPLHLATLRGDYEITKRILEAGGLVDELNAWQCTALHLAALQCNHHITQILLDCGASIIVRNMSLQTPAMIAAHKGRLDVLRLLSNTENINSSKDNGQRTILHYAAGSGKTETLVYLMTSTGNCDLEAKSANGDSVIAIAFYYSRSGIASLLNQSLPTSTFIPRNDNVLTEAIVNNYLTNRIVKMLLKRIPLKLLPRILHNRDRFGSSPLFAACTQTKSDRQSGLIDLRLDFGADIELDDEVYRTPLMAACSLGRLSAVKILIARGAQPWYWKGNQIVGAFRAARDFPHIQRWLLVGRFNEGLRCLTEAAHTDRD